MVHEVNLRKNANSSSAEGIDMSRQLQGFRINNINIRRRYGKDNAVWLRDILRDEVSCLLLDITGLVSNRYLVTHVSS